MVSLKYLKYSVIGKFSLLTIAWLVSRTITCFSFYNINTYVNFELFDIMKSKAMLNETNVASLHKTKIFLMQLLTN